MDPLLQKLYDTPFADAIRENGFLFPTIESIHVLAITIVVGSILIVDLRLLGVASRSRAVRRMTAEVLPVTWVAFVVALAAGSLLFASNAVKYAHNSYFEAKMVLLVVAFFNMLVFHLVTARDIAEWEHSPSPPWRARLAGGMSLCLWMAVIVCGRMIGFTMAAF